MTGPSAGDLYLDAVERWLQHTETPHDQDEEVCQACDFHMAQILQARSVWYRSAYRDVTVRRPTWPGAARMTSADFP